MGGGGSASSPWIHPDELHNTRRVIVGSQGTNAISAHCQHSSTPFCDAAQEYPGEDYFLRNVPTSSGTIEVRAPCQFIHFWTKIWMKCLVGQYLCHCDGEGRWALNPQESFTSWVWLNFASIPDQPGFGSSSVQIKLTDHDSGSKIVSYSGKQSHRFLFWTNKGLSSVTTSAPKFDQHVLWENLRVKLH